MLFSRKKQQISVLPIVKMMHKVHEFSEVFLCQILTLVRVLSRIFRKRWVYQCLFSKSALNCGININYGSVYDNLSSVI